MSLLAYGINHRTTPIHIREKLAFHDEHLAAALKDLTRHCHTEEAVILSTCNRTEIYTTTTHITAIQNWLLTQKAIDIDLTQHGYAHTDAEAVRHIMRVASGLDSMVLGEPQILGQMKKAYFAAQNAGATGAFLNQLFPAVFSASKDIRTNTDIGANPMTMAYTITHLAKNYYETLTDRTILLIGAGETIQLVATHLHSIGVKKIIVANRTVEKSTPITHAAQAQAIHIQDIPHHINHCDIIISATASQLPLIGKGLIERTLQHNSARTLLLIDLAIPRDIEPEVKDCDRVHLFHLDDLQAMIANNVTHRKNAAKQAETMIDLQANQFYEKMRVFHARHVIAEYRQRLDGIRLQEQEKALQQLINGHDPKQVLEQFGHSLINKIMHHPTVKLREAASAEHCEMFQRIKLFFELT